MAAETSEGAASDRDNFSVIRAGDQLSEVSTTEQLFCQLAGNHINLNERQSMANTVLPSRDDVRGERRAKMDVGLIIEMDAARRKRKRTEPPERRVDDAFMSGTVESTGRGHGIAQAAAEEREPGVMPPEPSIDPRRIPPERAAYVVPPAEASPSLMGAALAHSSERSREASERSDRAFREPSDRAFREPSDRAFREPSDRAVREPSDRAFREPSDRAFRVPSGHAFQGPSGHAAPAPSGNFFSQSVVEARRSSAFTAARATLGPPAAEDDEDEPLQPPPPPPQPRPTLQAPFDDRERMRRHALLLELRGLERDNIPLTRAFTMDDPSHEMEFELERQRAISHRLSVRKMLKSSTIAGIRMGAVANKRAGGIIRCGTWAEDTVKTLDRYDSAYDGIYRQYFQQSQTSPVMELVTGLGLSLAMAHVENTWGERAAQEEPSKPRKVEVALDEASSSSEAKPALAPRRRAIGRRRRANH
jgi:hypothetical protein